MSYLTSRPMADEDVGSQRAHMHRGFAPAQTALQISGPHLAF
jgi:hypothetical protein